MSPVHRVHPNHMRTWDKIFMSLSPDKQAKYEEQLDTIFKEINTAKEAIDEKIYPLAAPDIFKKNSERLY